MEALKDPVSVRVARINSEITGKAKNTSGKLGLLRREAVLDALQIFYEECCSETLQKSDSNIAEFVKKYKNAMKDIKSLRVNISDFEIKNLIGCGHFGDVHVVKEKQTGDVYAMKTIRKFDNEIKRMSFEEERNIMAFSNSPWLTSLQYSFQDSSYLFFVMEYHPGGDLLGLLYRKGGTLPESASLFYIAELVLALEALHNIGYVHRDIKPDNILIDRCGHLKLADFGSAAKLDKDGLVKVGLPVGTPDYIAPEVLQCLDNKSEKASAGYGISCDFWSLGILAYELTIGKPPFQGQSTTTVYSKILNHLNNLKFPADLSLSQGYVGFIKALLTDVKTRLKPHKVKSHPVFKDVNFDTLRDRVPPYVPKINSNEDISNFTDIQARKKHPSIENFKKRSQFSGRNLPFIGFTFTHDPQDGFEATFHPKKSEILENLKAEVEVLRMTVSKSRDFNQEKDRLEHKLDETSIKLQSVEALRDKLEKQLAESIAESSAVKRTLELERKERANLEKKALDLIKGAKMKWEQAEKTKVDALELEIKQLKSKIEQLNHTNRMLDEQLQHAMKMDAKNRQSIETEKNLSRRSVIGLENLLEKVSSDRQNQITELQSKLNDELYHNTDLQNQIATLQDELRDREAELKTNKENLKKCKTEHDLLKSKLHENEGLIGELSGKVNELEKDLERIDDYESEIKKLRNMFEDSQKTIKDLQNKTTILEGERQRTLQEKLDSEDVKEKLGKVQVRVNILEKQLEQEKEQCDLLKKRLKEAENNESSTQELREKQLQFYKMQKELSDCKIDKRILERELKEAKAEIKQLQDSLSASEKALANNKSAQEAALLELSSINDNISLELVKSKETIKSLQEQLQNEKTRTGDEKVVVKELKGILNVKEAALRSLEDRVGSLQNEVSNLTARCQREEGDKTKLMSLVEQLQKEKAQLSDVIQTERSEKANMKLNLDALREACTLLEGQVTEYEKLVELSKTKQSELTSNTEKLIADLCEARKETQEAKRQINEQKSLRAFSEQKVKRLQEDIASLEKEMVDYKSQCVEYKRFSAELTDDLTAAEEKLSSAEVTINSYSRQIEKLSAENRMLKEEISDHITKIAHLKDSKYRLTHQVNDLNNNMEALIQKIRELERSYHEQMNYNKEREMKAEARDKQHLKLIDYLQSKIEEQSHKKKTLTEVIFGSSKKENHPPISLALNYKDLESELVKEKESNRKLKEEVFKLKAATLCELNSNVMEKMGKMEKSKSEILTPRSKAALSQIAVSPSKGAGDFRQNSLTRMHHNIPHRFDSKMNTTVQKCAQCNNQILIGRNYHACKECKVSAHVNCSSMLPKVCGLPKKLAEHYKETLEKADNGGGGAQVPGKAGMQEAVCEGWVKVPCTKTNSWQKRYARLTQSYLDIYAHKPEESGNQAPLERFPLKPEESHGRVVLEPLQSEIGIPVASSDIPFIMKLEVSPETTCWPAKCLILMTLSAKDKDAWFAALQTHFASDKQNSKLEPVVRLPSGIEVNCVVALTDTITVFGADKGLFAYYDNGLLQIGGPSQVEQIVQFVPGNMVLMVTEPKSKLICCDVNHLINLAQCTQASKPTLKYRDVNVNGLLGFHIVQASRHSSHQKIAVATTQQLIILEHHFGTGEFIPVRILDTAQPTSCMLFTENSLLVGADKFFEIDLNSLKPEEFLDMSDVILKQACTYQSFPVSIVEVCANPKEYLLTFNLFSVFVDEYGRSSRPKEIKNEHLPIALHYAKRYLYIVQFGAVEIVKITEEAFNTAPGDTYRLELNKFKYLGCNSRGIYLEQDSDVKFLTAKNLPDFDAVSLVSDNTETVNNSNESEFSFTSSMVQSLDGHLSDSEQSEAVRRVIKFDQTDF